METVVLKNKIRRMLLDALIWLGGLVVGIAWIESSRWPSYPSSTHVLVWCGTVISGLMVVMGVTAIRVGRIDRIVIDATGLKIQDILGSTTITFSNMADTDLVPYRSVGIAVRDRDAWLATFEGPQENLPKIRALSELHKKRSKFDVVVHAKYLEGGAEGLLSLISERRPPPA